MNTISGVIGGGMYFLQSKRVICLTKVERRINYECIVSICVTLLHMWTIQAEIGSKPIYTERCGLLAMFAFVVHLGQK